MEDYIVRATAANATVRAFAATTRELVETARMVHHTSPVATAALGRLLTAGSMMGSMLKNETDLLTLKIDGDGPIGGLLVTADGKGDVKGYAVCPDVMLPPSPAGKLDVGGAVGHGTLRVIKDLGLKEPYTGQTSLQSGEIAEDLTWYFASSEQVPSTVGLGVLMNRDNTVRRAGGFLIQLMPFAEQEVIEKLEENIKAICSVTSMLDEGDTPEQILERLLAGLQPEMTDRLPTRYHCGCSRQRVEKAIISIGRKEIADMIREEKPITVNCHFCEKEYVFSMEELSEILTQCGSHEAVSG